MINDFDESILFSLSLIQSAIERVTNCCTDLSGCLSFLKNSISIGRRHRHPSVLMKTLIFSQLFFLPFKNIRSG